MASVVEINYVTPVFCRLVGVEAPFQSTSECNHLKAHKAFQIGACYFPLEVGNTLDHLPAF